MSTLASASTPVRAITTTLLTRSTPSIPAPTQKYESIVKSILKTRLIKKAFLYSAIFSWTCTSTCTIWNLGGVSSIGGLGTLLVPFHVQTLLIALLSWGTMALPAIVLRKVYLTPTRTPATSPSTLVKASLAKPATSNTIFVYAISALAAVGLSVWASYLTGNGTQGLTIFVKSKKHPLYLNGTFLFVLLSQLSVALVFSLRNVTLDRYVFRWSREETSTRRFNVTHILQSFIVAALLASLALPIAGFAFFLIRTTTLPLLYKLPILHNFLRPFTAHFLRGPWTIFLPFRHISLLIRTWFLAFTTLVTWEFSNTVFETFIYNPLSVIGSTPEPHVTLISGISSTDLGFRYMAYQDIRKFSSSETETAANQRSALFNDQKYNPSLWSHLVRESLVFLGKDYQHLLRRGKPAPPAPVKPVLPVAPATPSRLNTPTPLIRTSIFKSAKQASPIRNVVESLGSDGPLAQALNAGAEAAHIPELFKSMEAAVLPAAPAKKEEEQTKKPEEKKGKVESVVERGIRQMKERLCEVVVNYAPPVVQEFGRRLDDWWNKERLEKIAQSNLPNMELDAVIVEVLSTLVSASLTEDKYGVVQRDIPKILEAMLSFHSAIQSYRAEVQAKYTPPVQDQVYTPEEIDESEALRLEVERASEVLNYLSEYLRAGIARIVRTFGDKLLAFKFPPRVAERLQPFLEYC